MITTIYNGDIFHKLQPGEGLVNPVNCEGVMGAGLALEFKKRFPRNFVAYEEACRERPGMRMGLCFVYSYSEGYRFSIINFPTKKKWSQPSQLLYIDSGLHDVYRRIRDGELKVTSLRIPALGCGLGGLCFRDVEMIVWSNLKDVDLPIKLYAPEGVHPK